MKKFHRMAVASVVAAASVAGTARAQWFEDAIRDVGALGDIDLSAIGESREGRPLHLLTIGDPAASARGAVLIVAGLDARHRVGTEAAIGVARRLAEAGAETLDGRVVYVIPMLNPDVAAWRADARTPANDAVAIEPPTDDDRDGRTDEDGPIDLDGDGVIATMRIADPPIGSGLRRTHVIDEDEPRLMRPAKADEGEQATHAIIVEGRDQDGDGRIAEDARGGVDLLRNFPARWPEHDGDAGAHALSAPESRALVRWMLEHDEIIAVVVYGPHDTLTNAPAAGTMDVTGRVPVGLMEEDAATHKRIAERFKEITGITGVEVRDDDRGALHTWAYAHFGAWPLATPVWTRPDLVETPKKESEDDDNATEAEDAEDVAEDAPDEEPRPDPKTPDGWWLRQADERGEGFIDWTAFDHPDLGAVEIGGFVPGFRMTPSASEMERLVAEQATFITDLLAMSPRLTLEAAAESLGADVHRIRVRVGNAGDLPTRTAMAVRADRTHPLLLTLDVESDRILGGPRRVSIDALAPGESREYQWIVSGPSRDRITVRRRSAVYGDDAVTIRLGDD